MASSQSLDKQQRTKWSYGNEIIVGIPLESCVFLSPDRIESHIEVIPTLLEDEHLKRKYLKGAADDLVSSTCRVSSSLYIHFSLSSY